MATAPKPKVYTCPYCGQKFPSASQCTMHKATCSVRKAAAAARKRK